MIGDEVTVTVLGVKGNQVRIGVNAPKDVVGTSRGDLRAHQARAHGRRNPRRRESVRTRTAAEAATNEVRELGGGERRLALRSRLDAVPRGASRRSPAATMRRYGGEGARDGTSDGYRSAAGRAVVAAVECDRSRTVDALAARATILRARRQRRARSSAG